MERSTDTRIYGQPAPDHTADAESLAGLYAFGVLDGADLVRFERHLAGCGRCAEIVDGDLAMVGAISLTVPEVEAAPDFKERLMQRATAELDAQAAAQSSDDPATILPFRTTRPAGRSLAWLLPLAAVVVMLLAGAALLNQQFAAMQVIRTAALENRATGGRAEVLVRPSGEGVIQMHGFETLRDGRVYQAWVIRPGSQPQATGASVDGNGTLTLDGDVRGAKVAVTLEAGPGARTPTLPPFLIGDVPT